MQIAQVRNRYIYPYCQQTNPNISRNISLARDCVSFSGRQFLTLPKNKIFDSIDKSINPNNFLGEGKEASVYRIEGTNYCVRINSEYPNNYKKVLDFKLTDEDKINHIVAKLGDGSSILKYIEGIDLFVTQKTLAKQSLLKQTVRATPISSFQKLLSQIAYAKDKDMIFDCCSTNVIINPHTKELTAIDFYKNSLYEPEIVRPLCSMYSAFTVCFDDAEYRKICANKILNAAIDEISKDSDICMPIREFDFSSLIHKLKYDGLIDNPNYYTLLSNTSADIKSLKLQVLTGKNVIKELNGRIKIAKSLVKQLF